MSLDNFLTENIRVHLHKPRWSGLLHTSATLYSLLLPDYTSVQHVAAQRDVRVNQAPGEMMQSRDSVNKMHEAAAGVTPRFIKHSKCTV